MATKAGGQHVCKTFHVESDKAYIKRIHSMDVQDAQGNLTVLKGKTLPTAMVFYRETSPDGQQSTKVLVDGIDGVLFTGKRRRISPLLRIQDAWMFGLGILGGMLFACAVLLLHRLVG